MKFFDNKRNIKRFSKCVEFENLPTIKKGVILNIDIKIIGR